MRKRENERFKVFYCGFWWEVVMEFNNRIINSTKTCYWTLIKSNDISNKNALSSTIIQKIISKAFPSSSFFIFFVVFKYWI